MSVTLRGKLPRRPFRRIVVSADAGRDRPDVPSTTRRVRHEIRDGVAVIAFSALASTGVALALLLLVTLAG
jgi:hypothetical protein